MRRSRNPTSRSNIDSCSLLRLSICSSSRRFDGQIAEILLQLAATLGDRRQIGTQRADFRIPQALLDAQFVGRVITSPAVRRACHRCAARRCRSTQDSGGHPRVGGSCRVIGGADGGSDPAGSAALRSLPDPPCSGVSCCCSHQITLPCRALGQSQEIRVTAPPGAPVRRHRVRSAPPRADRSPARLRSSRASLRTASVSGDSTTRPIWVGRCCASASATATPLSCASRSICRSCIESSKSPSAAAMSAPLACDGRRVRLAAAGQIGRVDAPVATQRQQQRAKESARARGTGNAQQRGGLIEAAAGRDGVVHVQLAVTAVEISAAHTRLGGSGKDGTLGSVHAVSHPLSEAYATPAAHGAPFRHAIL